MVKKVVGALVLAGSLAMGSAGVAGAAPSPNCTNAPAVIARLQTEESNVASVVASLQAIAARGGREARWLQWPIAFLTRVEAGLASRVSSLQALCPSGGGSSSSGSGGGTVSFD